MNCTPDSAEEQTTIWIVEDNQFYRNTLESELQSLDPGFIVRSFSTMEAALAELTTTADSPRVVLVDIGLPGQDGIEGLKPIKLHDDSIQVVILTVFDDSDKIFSAIRAGANGYLLKGEEIETIGQSIRRTLIGEASISPAVASKILRSFQHKQEPQDDFDLTDREQDCLKWLIQGKTKRQIAEIMEVSFSTIDYHVRNIYNKLHVSNRAALVNEVNRRRLFRG
ncbi:response regulator transcription factor [Bremerella sp. JC770]|uniref:response regulator transcription factor n=1 Tax=Bremerella sp. JC770 TaxID=3232137 RepID=UPI0034593B0C